MKVHTIALVAAGITVCVLLSDLPLCSKCPFPVFAGSCWEWDLVFDLILGLRLCCEPVVLMLV